MLFKGLHDICPPFAGLVLGAVLMRANLDDSVELDAARIAVVELKASLDPSRRIDGEEPTWRVDSETRSLTSEQLIAFLAKSPKPIQCRATTDSVAGIDLDCQPASDSLSKFMRMSADYVLQRIQNAWTNADTGSVDVLVRSDREEAVVSYSAFAHWLRSYSVRNVSVEYIFDPPPGDAVRLGARMTVVFARRRQ